MVSIDGGVAQAFPGHTLTQTHDLAYLVFETIRISGYGAHDDEAGGVRSQVDDSDAL
jgi:hypothetical protein